MTTIDPSSFPQDPASVSNPAPAAAPSPTASAEAAEQLLPAATPFDWIGGEPAVRTLVDRFYDLMDLEPAYQELRAAHGTTLADARDKLFWFLCGWLGGPDHYIERFGHPRLRMRHMPFSIGIKERDQWVACMDQAMGETGVPEALRVRLRESFMGTADWMRNRGG
ncbi:group II truncated hemoglobin [Paracidovorax cattleyae]|uniref:group II truncated hemoglobin n=1 Tax=Paracidovorax cattleyae TaxID=80868 RepID=UPI001E435FBF|nr:group II truncated hemoglobin [Paracidovorax cattleyae]